MLFLKTLFIYVFDDDDDDDDNDKLNNFCKTLYRITKLNKVYKYSFFCVIKEVEKLSPSFSFQYLIFQSNMSINVFLFLLSPHLIIKWSTLLYFTIIVINSA